MSEKDRSGAIEAVQWLNATGVLDQIVRDIIVPPLVAAIKAEAIATARAEGRREGMDPQSVPLHEMKALEARADHLDDMLDDAVLRAEKAEAEVARMRPVVEAAAADADRWRGLVGQTRETMALVAAVDAYRASAQGGAE